MNFIDKFLLIRFPVIWRSNLHYIILYSFIVGNLFFFILGRYFFYIELEDNITIQSIENTMWSLYSILSIAIFYWVYTQLKKPKIKYIKVFILNLLILSSIILNPISFLVPHLDNISKLVSNDIFYKEFNFHYENNFWVCNLKVQVEDDIKVDQLIDRFGEKIEYQYFKKHKENVNLTYIKYINYLIEKRLIGNENNRKELNDDIPFLNAYYQKKTIRFKIFYKTMHIDPLVKGNVNDLDELESLVNPPICSGVSSKEKNIYPSATASLLFYKKMTAIKDAKDFKLQAGHFYNIFILKLPQYLCIALGLNMVFNIFFYVWGEIREYIGNIVTKNKLTHKKSGFIIDIDNRLLIDYPITWFTRIHRYLYKIIIFIIIGIIVSTTTRLWEGNPFFYFLYFIVCNIYTILWAYKKNSLSMSYANILNNQYILLCYILCVFLLPFIVYLCSYFFLRDTKISFLVFQVNLACILLSFAFMSSFSLGKKGIILSFIMIGLITPLIVISNNIFISYIIQGFWLSSLIVVIIWYFYNPSSEIVSWIASINLMSIGLVITSPVYGGHFLRSGIDMFSKYLLMTLFCYIILTIPSRMFIVKYSCLPK